MNYELLKQLKEINCLKHGEFTLKSGIKSDIYIDLRILISYPQILTAVCMEIKKYIIPVDLIVGVPYSGIPFACNISTSNNIPMIMVRKEVKDYGTKKIIEGVYKKGDECIIIEDIITSGSSLLETITTIESEGLKIIKIIVIINRNQGGYEKIKTLGYDIQCIFNLENLQ